MSGEGRKPEWPDHRRSAVDVGLAAAVGSGDQGQLTQRRNEVTERAIAGNGEGVEHDAELDHVFLQFGEFCGGGEFVNASSGWVFLGALKVMADDGGCVRPGDKDVFAAAG